MSIPENHTVMLWKMFFFLNSCRQKWNETIVWLTKKWLVLVASVYYCFYSKFFPMKQKIRIGSYRLTSFRRLLRWGTYVPPGWGWAPSWRRRWWRRSCFWGSRRRPCRCLLWWRRWCPPRSQARCSTDRSRTPCTSINHLFIMIIIIDLLSNKVKL